MFTSAVTAAAVRKLLLLLLQAAAFPLAALARSGTLLSDIYGPNAYGSGRYDDRLLTGEDPTK